MHLNITGRLLLVIIMLFSILYIGQGIFSYCLSGDTMILNDDMHQEFLNAAIVRQSILEYKRFPLWSPHIGGGYPLYAYPHDISLLLPFTFLILVFGELIGVKLGIILIYIFGILGIFLYLQHRFPGHKFIPPFFALVYAASPRFTETLLSGNYNELFAYLFPLLLFFYIKGQKSHVYLFFALLISAMLAIFGKFTYLFVLLLLFVYAAIDFILLTFRSPEKRTNAYQPIIYYFVFLLFSGLFSLSKVLPAVLLVLGITYEGHTVISVLKNIHYYDHLLYFLICIFFVYFYILVLSIIKKINFYRNGLLIRIFQIHFIVYFLFILLNIFSNKVNYGTITIPKQEETGVFYQIAGRFHGSNKEMNSNTLRTQSSLAYLNFSRNIGTIDWDDCGLTIPTKVQPRYYIYAPDKSLRINRISTNETIIDNPLYRGEAFVGSGSGTINDVKIEVNRIKLDIEGEGSATIIINQNYDSNWVSPQGKVIDANGLLGVDIELGGPIKLTLVYRPWLFYISFAISIVSIIVYIILSKHYKPFNKTVFKVN